jgi:hypothetical protein
MQTNLFGKDLFEKMKSGGSSKMSIDIHTKIKLKDIDISDTYIDIWFEDPTTSATINKRLWIPDIAKTTARDGMSVQETYETRIHEELYHLLDLTKCMVGIDVASNIPISGLKETALSIRTLLMPYTNTKFLNLKVTSTSDGKYPELSRFPGYLETYTEGEPTKLKFKPSEISRMNAKNSASDASSKPDINNLV